MNETLKIIIVFVVGCFSGCITGASIMCLMQVGKDKDNLKKSIIPPEELPKQKDYEIFNSTWGDKKEEHETDKGNAR